MVTNTEDDDDSQDAINYKAQYRSLKRKLKFLIYVSKLYNLATKPRLLPVSLTLTVHLDLWEIECLPGGLQFAFNGYKLKLFILECLNPSEGWNRSLEIN